MTKHAKLSPSSAPRWLACPGSVALSEKVEQPEPSIYALEGTAAHRLAELAINKHEFDCWWALGKKVKGVEVTEEMIAAIDMYLNHIVDIELESDCRIFIEEKIVASSVSKSLYGTADCIIEDHDEDILHVIDYKHGQGVVVSPVENPQLAIYGIGALDLLGRYNFIDICLTVIQPRSRESAPIETWKIPVTKFYPHWKRKLKDGIKRVKTHPNEYSTGEHCRWCHAKIICPAQQQEAQELAKLEFKEPAELSKKKIKHILDSADRVQAFIEEVRRYAHKTINEGGSIPGYKLVQRRSNRKWTSEKDVIRKLKDRRLKKKIIFNEPKLKSPAQLEKVIGKDKVLRKFIDKHTTKPDSGLTLVPVSDSREGTTSARKDFE